MRFRCQIGTPVVLAPSIGLLRRANSAAPPAPARPSATRRPRRGRQGLALGTTAVAVLVLAAACASQQPPSRIVKIEPVFEVRHGSQSTAAYFSLGQYYEGTQEWAKAVLAYEQSVAADPLNADAQGALGVALARTGRLSQAEAALRKAVALVPGKGSLRNNLGYLLLLEDKADQAVAEFKAVVEQDGHNAVALANLREAMRRAAPDAQLAMALPAAAEAASADARPAALASAPGTAAVEALRIGYGSSEVAPAPAGATAVQTGTLEISNGNGVTGMAARVGEFLASRGLERSRVSNHLPYTQRFTVVQYRVGHEADAQRVARLLPASTHDAPATAAALRSDVRIIIGRDWVRDAACVGSYRCNTAMGRTDLPAD